MIYVPSPAGKHLMYFHIPVMQSQGIIYVLSPPSDKMKQNKTKSIESQNNLKPLGLHPHCQESSKLVLSAPAQYFPQGADESDWTEPHGP